MTKNSPKKSSIEEQQGIAQPTILPNDGSNISSFSEQLQAVQLLLDNIKQQNINILQQSQSQPIQTTSNTTPFINSDISNVTLNKNLQNEQVSALKQLRDFKAVLPTFDGESIGDEFLKKYKSHFNMRKYDQKIFLEAIQCNVQGIASTWYLHNNFVTFESFCKSFEQEYCLNQLEKQQKLFQLFMLDSESLEKYQVRCKMLCYECNILDEKIICEYFKNGLPQKYKTRVSPKQVFNNLKNCLIFFENMQYQETQVINNQREPIQQFDNQYQRNNNNYYNHNSNNNQGYYKKPYNNNYNNNYKNNNNNYYKSYNQNKNDNQNQSRYLEEKKQEEKKNIAQIHSNRDSAEVNVTDMEDIFRGLCYESNKQEVEQKDYEKDYDTEMDYYNYPTIQLPKVERSQQEATSLCNPTHEENVSLIDMEEDLVQQALNYKIQSANSYNDLVNQQNNEAEVNAAYKRLRIKDQKEDKEEKHEDRITKEYSFYGQLQQTKANISILELMTLEPYRSMLLQDLNRSKNYQAMSRQVIRRQQVQRVLRDSDEVFKPDEVARKTESDIEEKNNWGLSDLMIVVKKMITKLIRMIWKLI